MTLSDIRRSQISNIIWITIAWTLFSLSRFVNVYTSILEMGFDSEQMDIPALLLTNILRGLLAGIIGGSIIIFVWEKWLRTKPYGWTLKSLVFSYVAVFFLISIPMSAFYQSTILNKSIMDGAVWGLAFSQQFSLTALFHLVSWLVIVLLTVIALQVNDKYGPGIFRKFLLGRYFSPRKEERIFMFLDLRSSTSIAEKLGEERYFSFLKDVFKYSTPSILKYGGEIYQYVGDEIVISWELDSGRQNANCIQCFFDIQASLNEEKSHFTNYYQTYPEFKAGIHCGYVMAGEIGIVKREIAFSGDVLNTTARIQSKCNEQGVNLLLSKSIIDLIDLDDALSAKEIGQMELRGKKELVTLYAVTPAIE